MSTANAELTGEIAVWLADHAGPVAREVIAAEFVGGPHLLDDVADALDAIARASANLVNAWAAPLAVTLPPHLQELHAHMVADTLAHAVAPSANTPRPPPVPPPAPPTPDRPPLTPRPRPNP